MPKHPMVHDMKAVREWRAVLAAVPCESEDDIQLMFEVHLEVTNAEYLNFKHGERHTRNKGCTGPLCRKALRDWQRERLAAHHEARGTTYTPYRRSSRMVRMDTLLVPLKAAHDKEFTSRRIVTSEELQAAELMNQLVA